MTLDRFEAWWNRNPERRELSGSAKELARSIWNAACEDSTHLLTMSAELMDEAAGMLSAVSPEVLEAIPTHRWSLADELGGAASLCRDSLSRPSADDKEETC